MIKKLRIGIIIAVLLLLIAYPISTYATDEIGTNNTSTFGYNISKKYNMGSNSVTVTISSESQIRRDKDESWLYSEDQYSISKEYKENTNYYTTIRDYFGHSLKVKIEVTEVQEFKIDTEEVYDSENNISIVNITSNLKLKNDKDKSWTYSEDMKSVSKKYTENTNYYTTINDQFGNSKKVNIVVRSIQDRALKSTISSNYEPKSNNVIVTIKSNNKLLKNKDSSWKYSEDCLSISKVYDSNTDYYTSIKDVYGNIDSVHIVVTEIDSFKFEVVSKYNSDKNNVVVTIQSKNKLNTNKDSSWKYSEDCMSVSKEYNTNTDYITSITDIYGNVKKVRIIVNEIKNFEVTLDKKYNSETNSVIVKLTSNIPLLKNKDSSWKYSEDCMSITKEYNTNTDYTTSITDINGTVERIRIKIDEIQALPLEIINTYNEDTNTVTIRITSKTKLLKDKDASWKYSDDCLNVTKEFEENANFNTSITDIYGNTNSINIVITEVKILQLSVNKKYNAETNTVCVEVVSNLKLKNINDTEWTYSEDNLTAKKDFKVNCNTNIVFTDFTGKTKEVNIDITEIDTVAPKVEVQYEFLSDGKILVNIISNEAMLQDKNPEFWKLSDDKLKYTRIYDSDVDYTTFIKDIYKNETVAHIMIKIKDVKSIDSNIDIKYVYCSTESEYVIVNSKKEFADTKSGGSWKLTNNGYTYIKEYLRNTNYDTTFTFIDGSKETINIVVSQVEDFIPTVAVEYEFIDGARIAVHLKSNKKLLNNKDNSVWSLSEDQLTYTRIYDKNVEEDYITKVRDLHDNEVSINIKMKIVNDNYNQNDNSSLNVQYVLCSNNVVYVVLNSNVKLLDNKIAGGWKHFNNGYSYVKCYTENTAYKTNITNINNTTTTIPIVITYFKNTLEGIDVSSWNGRIDWASVKNIDFVMVRAGYRGYTAGSLNEDSYFEDNAKNAYQNGMKVGVYFYTQALDEHEAIEEADYVIGLIKKYNLTIDFPIAIDVESTAINARAENLSVEDRTKVCIAFCNRVREAGYIPMVYANKNWLSSKIDTNKINYDIWLAQYNSSVTYEGTYVMWQYTSSGSVNGISGNVDLSHLYKKYI